MKINTPQVTMDDMARTIFTEERPGIFADWMTQFVFFDEDNEIYSVAMTLMAMKNMSVLVAMAGKGRCKLFNVPGTIYKKAIHPELSYNHNFVEKGDSMAKIVPSDEQIVITMGDYYKLVISKDHSWHFIFDSGDGKFKADFIQRPVGYPLWYGRDSLISFTEHCIQCGYVWSGDTEGTLWIEGKEVKVKGRGIHERAVCLDNSTAEVGAGEDWGEISFDEMHTEFWQMLLSGNQDLHIYDIENDKDYCEGKLTIERDDWAYVNEFDGFLAHTYHITEEVEDGRLEITAHVGNANFWGNTNKRPENPCATSVFDKVEGRFVYNDGRVRKLTNGAGSMAVRQWRPYPDLFPRNLFVKVEEGNVKFRHF